jgi:hypothetical protein
VLLVDDVLDALSLQPMADGQAGLPATDDDDLVMGKLGECHGVVLGG